MEDPLVTIILPVFDGGDTLSRAVASVTAQSYSNWELIIIDDGSPRSVEPVIRRISDGRIRFYRLERNMGRGWCRAMALEKANGKYLAMVDADDWGYPCKLQRQVRILEEHRDLVAVSCPVAVINDANEITGIRGCQGPNPLVLKGSGCLESFGICFPATMFRMDAARCSGFRRELRAVEDRDFMIRAFAGQQYAIDSEVLYAYRHDLGGTSNTGWRAYMSMLSATRKLLKFYMDTCPRAARIELLRMYVGFPQWVCRWFLARFFGLRTNRDRVATDHEIAQFMKACDAVETALSRDKDSQKRRARHVSLI